MLQQKLPQTFTNTIEHSLIETKKVLTKSKVRIHCQRTATNSLEKKNRWKETNRLVSNQCNQKEKKLVDPCVFLYGNINNTDTLQEQVRLDM